MFVEPSGDRQMRCVPAPSCTQRPYGGSRGPAPHRLVPAGSGRLRRRPSTRAWAAPTGCQQYWDARHRSPADGRTPTGWFRQAPAPVATGGRGAAA